MKTSPITVEYIDHLGCDLSAVNAARVSFAKHSEHQEDGSLSSADTRLLRYLADHDHWSPFAHTSLSLRVKAPIFLARQLVKHTVGCAWNETSRRYVDEEPEFWFPEVLHGRPDNLKQGAGGDPVISQAGGMEQMRHSTATALSAYTALLNGKVAPEEARMVLPLNTMTEWVWTGSVVYWARVHRLRSDSHAQLAAQEVAQRISEVAGQYYPACWAALTGGQEVTA